jgi:hypothetical protein
VIGVSVAALLAMVGMAGMVAYDSIDTRLGRLESVHLLEYSCNQRIAVMTPDGKSTLICQP